MTISPSENPEALFPPDLLETDNPQKPWRIAHVKSRREKALAGFLAKKGIGYYLPMVTRKQSSRTNRVRYSLVPVFPGYIFLRADDSDRHTVFRTNQIATIIEVPDPDTLVHELKQIRAALTGDMPVYPVDFLSVGQRVRVKKGPMKDVEGVIVRKDRHFRLVLSVTAIAQSVSVELDE
ncbi:MAG: transcription termination/antitermination NusG family protein, partial [Desulfobacterales bacterium]